MASEFMNIASINHTPLNVSGQSPKVTWLVCAHFSSIQLKEALQSCLDQTFSDFELVVVANGLYAHEVVASVKEWYGADPRVNIFSTPISHLTFSLSLGVHYAKGEFIARMDADDIAYRTRLEKQYQYFLSDPNLVVLGTAYDLINPDGVVLNTVYPPQQDSDIRKELLFRNPICHPSVMLRKQRILNVGGYLGGLQAEDYDLWVRLSADPKNKFANLSDVCMGYRVTGGEARGSILAYASQGASQFGYFLMGHGLQWFIAAGISFGKVARIRLRQWFGWAR
jgi:glycosyltransferase involved in cell wall biosynthesis